MYLPISLAAKAHTYFDNSNTMFDHTINNSQPMAFAANQDQKINHMLNDMLKQDDIKYFVLAMKVKLRSTLYIAMTLAVNFVIKMV